MITEERMKDALRKYKSCSINYTQQVRNSLGKDKRVETLDKGMEQALSKKSHLKVAKSLILAKV